MIRKLLRWMRRLHVEVLPNPCHTVDRDPYSKHAANNARLWRQV